MKYKKKKKQKNKNMIVYLIIISLILLIAFASIRYSSKDNETEENKGILSVKFYSNGIEVKPNPGTLSIVGTTPGVTDMVFTVTLTNTGSYALTCNIISAIPSSLSSSINKDEKVILVGSKQAWTSGLLSTSQFESSVATLFNVTARCNYNSGSSIATLPDKIGSLSLLIRPDSSGASFNIDIGTGGTPTEYCGDNVCQSSETSSSCPGDCAVSNYVKFRTTDLTYVSGTAVAYTSSCGSTLTKYGKTNGACTTKYCDDIADLTIPSSTGTTKMFIQGNDICVCNPGIISHTYASRYSTSDSDASKVDSSSTSFDSSKEVTC